MRTGNLDALDAAYARMSSGRWQSDGYRAYCVQDGERVILFEMKHSDARDLNVEGIVALHNAWPAISEELRRARETIAAYREKLE